MDYKKSLNLPSTSFKMRGNLSQLEPKILDMWENENLYENLLNQAYRYSLFILHDGPPYANGHLHLGHVLNKVLKDMIVKIHLMKGEYAPYVPGWDCHGLPIEHQVEKELGSKKHEMTKSQVRKLCREYALKYVGLQRDEFKRLGLFGNWNDPYLTMSYHYEASIIRELGRFVEKGILYKNKRPVYWCPSCRTALAEAEVEYADKKAASIFVKFDAKNEWKEAKGYKTSVIIWTTTPWTIPSNRAVALNRNINYAIVSIGSGNAWVVAESLVKQLMERFEIKEFQQIISIKGDSFEGRTVLHPLTNADVPVVLADYVTTDSGTGVVHTAPGHGADDYQTGLKYNLELFSPIDDGGKFTKEVPQYEGMTTDLASEAVTNDLKSVNALIGKDKITHSYPHCWRCKTPIVFRATEQWFISMDNGSLRSDALKEIDNVTWIPEWGKNRIQSMIENRPDWCISRQRAWGVPIALFKCKSCGEYQMKRSLVEFVADIVEKKGADAWFDMSNAEMLPEGYRCSCGSNQFEKESDILDVWFDSGSSHAAVLENPRWGLSSPADLYLEGSDQHRGWFHSSLLESVGTRGKAPFKAVLTHGFVTDMNGKKMSKSLGNVISPEKVIKKYGADILRLWVASCDYQYDVHISDVILKRLVETYRKIRNTIRFMLGNLKQSVDDVANPMEIDRLILSQWEICKRDILEGYYKYQFHTSVKTISNFCNITLSNFYFDVIKDRLYCDLKSSHSYKSAQFTLNVLYKEIVRLISPILSFTSEEAWRIRFVNSVFYDGFPKYDESRVDKELLGRYEKLDEYRRAARIAIEPLKVDKSIGNSLELVIYAAGDAKQIEFLKGFDRIADIFMVSEFKYGKPDKSIAECEIDGVNMKFGKSKSERCERCWKYLPSVSENKICERCRIAISDE